MWFTERLKNLEDQGLYRRLRTLESPQQSQCVVQGQPMLAFCSNDYLGLANHPALQTALVNALPQTGMGAGASHLVSGHHVAHVELESALADFLEFDAALVFSTGYMANLGVVQALVGRQDAVFADKLNHASLNDAMLLSRATIQRFAHQDTTQLASQLASSCAQHKLIIVDAVFSMDGDCADLVALLALAEEYDAILLIDDAHGFGVLGAKGQGSVFATGLAGHPRIIYMATFGKAAGAAGAFVVASHEIITWLRQTARPYIYTTAMPPALAVVALASLNLIAESHARRQHLRSLITQLRSETANLPYTWLDSSMPIQPLILRDNHLAMDISQKLYQQGIWVPAIRPPTVPQGTARLRISLSASHSHADISRLTTALFSCIS